MQVPSRGTHQAPSLHKQAAQCFVHSATMPRNSRKSDAAAAARVRVLEGTVEMMTQIDEIRTLKESTSTLTIRRLLETLAESMAEARMDPFNDAILEKMRQTKAEIQDLRDQLLNKLDEIIQRAEQMNARMNEPVQ